MTITLPMLRVQIEWGKPIASESALIPPEHVALRVARVIRKLHPDDPGWPTAVGFIAKRTGEHYQQHYRECVEISDMIRADEREMRVADIGTGSSEGETR